jgi:hypothetical protein
VRRRAGGRGVDVEHPSAVLADAPPRQALEEDAEVDIEQDRRLQRRPERREQRIERLGLLQIAREAIEDEALLRIRHGEPFADHGEHDGIVDQLAGLHRTLRARAELGRGGGVGSLGHRLAQQVPGGDLGHAVRLDEPLRLRALTRAGGSHENDAHCVKASPGWRSKAR